MDKESAKKVRAILLEEAFRKFVEDEKAGMLYSDNPWSPEYRDLPDRFKKS